VKPQVTVIMATYNVSKFIDDCILSLLNQTYQNFIVKIIDDNSSDDTVSYINRWCEKDERIQLIDVHTENKGLTVTLNEIIRTVDTDYIARMDADDIALPMRLERQIQYMESNKDISVVGSWANNIDENGNIGSTRFVPCTNKEILTIIGKANPVIHPAAFLRTRDLKGIGGYNEFFRTSQDYELWFRFLINGYKISNLPEVLLHYRIISSHIAKRSIEYRIRDAKIRWNGTKLLKFPFYKRVVYFSIPVIIGSMPDFMKKIALKYSNILDPRQKYGDKKINL
jgi:glycosyltransferase EpsE